MILGRSRSRERRRYSSAVGDIELPRRRADPVRANLQARVQTIISIEANARQYCPEANKAWESRFPGYVPAYPKGCCGPREINGTRPGRSRNLVI
jgi:hypothetical protein